MLASDYFPNSYHDLIIKEEGVPLDLIKKSINLVEKSEPGITVYAGNVIIFKSKEGDIIVSDSSKVLPIEDYKQLQEEGEQLIEEVEDFLNR